MFWYEFPDPIKQRSDFVREMRRAMLSRILQPIFGQCTWPDSHWILLFETVLRPLHQAVCEKCSHDHFGIMPSFNESFHAFALQIPIQILAKFECTINFRFFSKAQNLCHFKFRTWYFFCTWQNSLPGKDAEHHSSDESCQRYLSGILQPEFSDHD